MADLTVRMNPSIFLEKQRAQRGISCSTVISLYAFSGIWTLVGVSDVAARTAIFLTWCWCMSSAEISMTNVGNLSAGRYTVRSWTSGVVLVLFNENKYCMIASMQGLSNPGIWKSLANPRCQKYLFLKALKSAFVKTSPNGVAPCWKVVKPGNNFWKTAGKPATASGVKLQGFHHVQPRILIGVLSVNLQAYHDKWIQRISCIVLFICWKEIKDGYRILAIFYDVND